jgi:4-carboxymuconolactone decarboxylase
MGGFMSRLSYVVPARMTDAQRALYDAIAGGKRAAAAKTRSLVTEEGGLTGPFNAWLHAPEMGKAWSALGEAMRFHTTLDRRLFELAVIVVAARWKSGHEWVAHSVLAREAGVEDDVIASVANGETPQFTKQDERIAYRFVTAMLSGNGEVDDGTYAQARDLLGEEKLVELASAVSYYTALAFSMNAFGVEPPKGFDHPWKKKS